MGVALASESTKKYLKPNTGRAKDSSARRNAPRTSSTSGIRALLKESRYELLLSSLASDGINFVGQLKGMNILRYLNMKNLYPLKERIQIVEDVVRMCALTQPRRSSNIGEVSSDLVSKDEKLTVDFKADINYAHTRPYLIEIHGQIHPVSSWTDVVIRVCEYLIENNPIQMGSLVEKPLFPNSKRPYFEKQPVHGLACKRMSNGRWVITNYNATTIVNICRALCDRCGIATSDIVIHYEKPCEESAEKIALTTDNSYSTVSVKALDSAIEAFIRNKGLSGCSAEQIEVGINQPNRRSLIRHAIDENNQIIELGRDHYVHRSMIVDIDEAADQLLEILLAQFSQLDDYTNHRLLFDCLRSDMSMFMNDNSFDESETIYYLARHLFSKEAHRGNRFVFYGNMHIWKKDPDYPKSLKGLLISRARAAGGLISRDECQTFLDKTRLAYSSVNQVLQITIDPTFLQYDTGRYLLSETMNTDKTWRLTLAKELSSLFSDSAFVIPRSIDERWLGRLPSLPLGLPWTILLLQEVIGYFKDIGYRTISVLDGQSFDTLHAVIVLTDSSIQTFADAAHEYLASISTLPQRIAAEDLRLMLRDAGMLSGNELVYNMHKALDDYRYAWSDANRTVYIRKE